MFGQNYCQMMLKSCFIGIVIILMIVKSAIIWPNPILVMHPALSINSSQSWPRLAQQPKFFFLSFFVLFSYFSIFLSLFLIFLTISSNQSIKVIQSSICPNLKFQKNHQRFYSSEHPSYIL